MGPADKMRAAFCLIPVFSVGGTAAPLLVVRAGPPEAQGCQS